MAFCRLVQEILIVAVLSSLVILWLFLAIDE